MPAHPPHTANDGDGMPAGALASDPTCAAILAALLAGRPLTAGEVGHLAGVSTAAATGQLAGLLDGGLVAAAGQGGHRYYCLAGPAVAAVTEALVKISPHPRVRGLRQSREAAALAGARSCYGHLAGRAGVALHAALAGSEIITPKDDGEAATSRRNPALPMTIEYEVTEHGAATLAAFGIDLTATRRSRRRFAGACLDWTERRPHLNGALGAALTARLLDLGWCERGSSRRALRITEPGVKGLAETFGCVITN